MKTLFLLALLAGLATCMPSCAGNSKTELQTWMQESCLCDDQSCAKIQRKTFWKLVQEFAGEAPSDGRANELRGLIDRGQECLEKLQVDIYAPA